MQNIWAFLLQTLAASVTAAVLLCVKAVFRRHFSPRWQYGVWTVLLLSLLLPAQSGGLLFPSLGLRLEALKSAVESTLHSAYSSPYLVTGVGLPLPLVPASAPQSVTDWLFLLYLAGAALLLLVHLAAYIRLRFRLRRAVPAGGMQLAQVERVCTAYSLRPCARTVVSPHAESAYVCGLLRPVLVLPAGKAVDDKVILHELLHRRCGDVAAGMLLCFLRCIHWCNPFLGFALRRAQADCEALCDQRVLEKLEGEERRDYGHILLSMADSRILRAPGTSSIANGGRNIRRRIESIARFRLYPRDMRLVSACIALVLLFSCVGWLTLPARAWSDFRAAGTLDERMAFARLHRAETPQQAFFLYAAALLRGDGCILARVTPLSGHAALADRLRTSDGLPGDETTPYGQCALYNLHEQQDEATALLAFESGHCFSLRAWKEDGWAVECLDGWTQQLEDFGFWSSDELPPSESYAAQTPLFDAKITWQYIWMHDIVSGVSGTPDLQEVPQLDPTLLDCGMSRLYFRAGQGMTLRWKGEEPAELRCSLLPYTGEPPRGDLPPPGLSGDASQSSSDGSSAYSVTLKPGELRPLGGGGTSGPAGGAELPATPDGYVLSVYRGDTLLDTVLLLPGGAS